VFALLSEACIQGAHACFVVGRSVIRGEVVDNLEILRTAATKHGFVESGVVTRSIPRTRKAFNLSHANIKQESVAVFRKS